MYQGKPENISTEHDSVSVRVEENLLVTEYIRMCEDNNNINNNPSYTKHGAWIHAPCGMIDG